MDSIAHVFPIIYHDEMLEIAHNNELVQYLDGLFRASEKDSGITKQILEKYRVSMQTSLDASYRGKIKVNRVFIDSQGLHCMLLPNPCPPGHEPKDLGVNSQVSDKRVQAQLSLLSQAVTGLALTVRDYQRDALSAFATVLKAAVPTQSAAMQAVITRCSESANPTPPDAQAAASSVAIPSTNIAADRAIETDEKNTSSKEALADIEVKKLSLITQAVETLRTLATASNDALKDSIGKVNTIAESLEGMKVPALPAALRAWTPFLSVCHNISSAQLSGDYSGLVSRVQGGLADTLRHQLAVVLALEIPGIDKATSTTLQAILDAIGRSDSNAFDESATKAKQELLGGLATSTNAQIKTLHETLSSTDIAALPADQLNVLTDQIATVDGQIQQTLIKYQTATVSTTNTDLTELAVWKSKKTTLEDQIGDRQNTLEKERILTTQAQTYESLLTKTPTLDTLAKLTQLTSELKDSTDVKSQKLLTQVDALIAADYVTNGSKLTPLDIWEASRKRKAAAIPLPIGMTDVLVIEYGTIQDDLEKIRAIDLAEQSGVDAANLIIKNYPLNENGDTAITPGLPSNLRLELQRTMVMIQTAETALKTNATTQEKQSNLEKLKTASEDTLITLDDGTMAIRRDNEVIFLRELENNIPELRLLEVINNEGARTNKKLLFVTGANNQLVVAPSFCKNRLFAKGVFSVSMRSSDAFMVGLIEKGFFLIDSNGDPIGVFSSDDMFADGAQSISAPNDLNISIAQSVKNKHFKLIDGKGNRAGMFSQDAVPGAVKIVGVDREGIETVIPYKIRGYIVETADQKRLHLGMDGQILPALPTMDEPEDPALQTARAGIIATIGTKLVDTAHAVTTAEEGVLFLDKEGKKTEGATDDPANGLVRTMEQVATPIASEQGSSPTIEYQNGKCFLSLNGKKVGIFANSTGLGSAGAESIVYDSVNGQYLCNMPIGTQGRLVSGILKIEVRLDTQGSLLEKQITKNDIDMCHKGDIWNSYRYEKKIQGGATGVAHLVYTSEGQPRIIKAERKDRQESLSALLKNFEESPFQRELALYEGTMARSIALESKVLQLLQKTAASLAVEQHTPHVFPSENPNDTYLVEEYVQGEDLSLLIRRSEQRKVNIQNSDDIIKALCQTYHLLHTIGISDADFQIKNVLCDKASKKVTIIDWDFIGAEGLPFPYKPDKDTEQLVSYIERMGDQYKNKCEKNTNVAMIYQKLFVEPLPPFDESIISNAKRGLKEIVTAHNTKVAEVIVPILESLFSQSKPTIPIQDLCTLLRPWFMSDKIISSIQDAIKKSTDASEIRNTLAQRGIQLPGESSSNPSYAQVEVNEPISDEVVVNKIPQVEVTEVNENIFKSLLNQTPSRESLTLVNRLTSELQDKTDPSSQELLVKVKKLIKADYREEKDEGGITVLELFPLSVWKALANRLGADIQLPVGYAKDLVQKYSTIRGHLDEIATLCESPRTHEKLAKADEIIKVYYPDGRYSGDSVSGLPDTLGDEIKAARKTILHEQTKLSSEAAPAKTPEVAEMNGRVVLEEKKKILPSIHFNKLQEIQVQKESAIASYEALRTRVEALSALAVDTSLISDLNQHPSPLDEQRLTLAKHQLEYYQTELRAVTETKRDADKNLDLLSSQAHTHIYEIDTSGDRTVMDKLTPELRSLLVQSNTQIIQLPGDKAADLAQVNRELNERSQQREKPYKELLAAHALLQKKFDEADTNLRYLTGSNNANALRAWLTNSTESNQPEAFRRYRGHEILDEDDAPILPEAVSEGYVKHFSTVLQQIPESGINRLFREFRNAWGDSPPLVTCTYYGNEFVQAKSTCIFQLGLRKHSLDICIKQNDAGQFVSTITGNGNTQAILDLKERLDKVLCESLFVVYKDVTTTGFYSPTEVQSRLQIQKTQCEKALIECESSLSKGKSYIDSDISAAIDHINRTVGDVRQSEFTFTPDQSAHVQAVIDLLESFATKPVPKNILDAYMLSSERFIDTCISAYSAPNGDYAAPFVLLDTHRKAFVAFMKTAPDFVFACKGIAHYLQMRLEASAGSDLSVDRRAEIAQSHEQARANIDARLAAREHRDPAALQMLTELRRDSDSWVYGPFPKGVGYIGIFTDGSLSNQETDLSKMQKNNVDAACALIKSDKDTSYEKLILLPDATHPDRLLLVVQTGTKRDDVGYDNVWFGEGNRPAIDGYHAVFSLPRNQARQYFDILQTHPQYMRTILERQMQMCFESAHEPKDYYPSQPLGDGRRSPYEAPYDAWAKDTTLSHSTNMRVLVTDRTMTTPVTRYVNSPLDSRTILTQLKEKLIQKSTQVQTAPFKE